MGPPIFGTRYVLAPTPEGEEHPNVIDRFVKQEHFCDTHCVWTDHHPDCALAQPEPVQRTMIEDFIMSLANEAIRTPEKSIHDLLMAIGYVRAAQPEQFAPEYVPMYGKSIPKMLGMQKPLTEEELFPHIRRCASYYGYVDEDVFMTASAGFVAFARAIERVHGIGGEHE